MVKLKLKVYTGRDENTVNVYVDESDALEVGCEDIHEYKGIEVRDVRNAAFDPDSVYVGIYVLVDCDMNVHGVYGNEEEARVYEIVLGEDVFMLKRSLLVKRKYWNLRRM